MRLGAPGLANRRRTILKWSVVVLAAAIAVAVDLVTKHAAEQQLVFGETHRILPFFFLERTANNGVAFGLFGGKGPFIIVANIIALIVVLVYVWAERRPLLAGIAGGSVIGGSLGNMIQRLTGDGHVTDFMKFPHWPNFNMADVFIDAGIAAIFIGLIVETIRVYRAGRSKPAAR